MTLTALTMATGIVCGLVFWIVARAAVLVNGVLPLPSPFAPDLLATGGDRERRQHRKLGREVAVLSASLLATLLGGVLAWLVLPRMDLPPIPVWVAWLALAGAVLTLAGAVYCMVRLVLARRRLMFAWAAKSAVGNILKRLNLAGNVVFHEVAVEASTVDHVVIGRKGVFALNVVARPLPKKTDTRPSADLRNGKLWMAGTMETLPVGEAARNMTVLSSALTRVVGHRVPVRSVLVVPGWHTVPNGEGNHLVLSESTLAMLTSWNTPDAFLMDEDCVAIQSWLHENSRAKRLD